MTRFLLIFCLVARCAFGTNYFVDWAGGNDSNSGLNTGAAWQHSPGDSGGPVRSLNPGDTVNFKLGVTYNSPHTIIVVWNGVTFQPAVGWGSGVVIFDGITGGGSTTNNEAIEVHNPNCFIHDIQITDYTGWGIANFSGQDSSGLIVSNCVIHHIGGYPYNAGVGGGGMGYGVQVREVSNVTVVSNLFYDLNETAVYNVTTVTNTVIWGNTMTNIQDHAVFFGSQGWGLVANNFIYYQTNGPQHDDNIQFQSWGLYGSLTPVVICGNWFWNGNSDTFFNALANCGLAYIFNNVFMNTDSTLGDGQDGNPVGILINTQQNPWDTFYIFNNTMLLKNGGNGGLTFAPRGGSSWGTNAFLYNNVVVESIWNEPLGTDAENVHHTYSGYNVFTNNSRGTYINGLSLAGLQSGYPAQEVNSVYGNVQFVNRNNSNLPASDLHLVSGSPGSGTGTNLSTLLPANTFAFLPTRYRVDPTVDSKGVLRGSAWDMGAFQLQTSTPSTIARVTNFKVQNAYINPH